MPYVTDVYLNKEKKNLAKKVLPREIGISQGMESRSGWVRGGIGCSGVGYKVVGWRGCISCTSVLCKMK